MAHRVSALDLSPVVAGETEADALRHTLDLAILCDRLGYHRYWLAEHHGGAMVASSSPEVLIGHVAQVVGGDHGVGQLLEDGDNRLFNVFQREGWWWSSQDPTPGTKLLPPPGNFTAERLPEGEGAPSNLFAAHLVAEGQKEWGAVWGTTLAHADAGSLPWLLRSARPRTESHSR